MEGYLLVDKPAGWTSFDVVAKIRGLVRTELKAQGSQLKARVGHSGTLDPFATGLLIILIGSYTKRQDEFMKLDKVYEATIRLGATSTTGDPEGEIVNSTEYEVPSLEQIQEILGRFTGEIEQMPPVYSAIKVNGKKAYELARAGKPVELKKRKVTIHSIKVDYYTWPELKITTHVSSGTYVRSLAANIGEALGSGAYTTSLRRTKIGEYLVENSASIDKTNISTVK